MTTKKYQELYVNGETYKTQLTKKVIDTPKWEKDTKKKIIAFIPGTVKEIHVKKGQKVKKGQNLLILEAMKMRNRVKSSIDGKVKTIYVKESQIVAKSHVLMELY